MEYPHWLMVAGAVLMVFGFVGIAFLKNNAEPAEDNLEQEVATPPPQKRAQLRSRLTQGPEEFREDQYRPTPERSSAALLISSRVELHQHPLRRTQ
jgi:hypothetical protein